MWLWNSELVFILSKVITVKSQRWTNREVRYSGAVLFTIAWHCQDLRDPETDFVNSIGFWMKFRLWTSNLEDGFHVHDDSFMACHSNQFLAMKMSLALQISLLFKLRKNLFMYLKSKISLRSDLDQSTSKFIGQQKLCLVITLTLN